MSRYRKVDVRVWADDKVRGLSIPKPNGRDCWLYLLTAKETIILPGAIPAGPAALAESLRWALPGFRSAFFEVEQAGMVVADWGAGLVWIPKAIHYNRPESPNVAKAWGKAFPDLPDCALKKRIRDEVLGLLSTMGEAFAEGFRKGMGESGAGAGAGAGSLFEPHAKFGSGATDVSHTPPVENSEDDRPTEAHWVTLAATLVTWMRAERSIAGLDDDRQSDLDAIEEWAWDWVRKYEPSELDLVAMKRAFVDFLGWSRRVENGGSLSVWCSQAVWQPRWIDERAKDQPQDQRKAS